MKAIIALLLAAAGSGMCFAKVPGPSAVGIAGGYKVGFASNGQPLASTVQVMPGALSGEALIRDLFNAPGPAGKNVPVTATRRLPWAAVARGAARVLPYAAAGVVIWDLYDQIRVKPDGTGGISADDGQDPETVEKVKCSVQVGAGTGVPRTAVAYGSSGPDSCGQLLSQIPSNWNSASPAYPVGQMSCSSSSSGTCSQSFVVPGAGTHVAWLSFAPDVVHQCPPVVDFPNPAYSVPGGPVGPDGKCPTGRYSPITEQEAAQRFEQKAPKNRVVETVQELLDRLPDLQPQPAVELSGPPKVEMEPKVRTETDAQGNTKTTTTKDVHNITYQGDSYTWNTTTVTVNNDGSTTEETAPEPVVGAVDPALGEVPDLYTQKYPDGLSGVWTTESAGLRSTPIFQFLAGLNPNFADGGCPVWSFPGGTVLGIQVGGDISVPCYVWSALRVFFVIGALLLARRLIFGG